MALSAQSLLDELNSDSKARPDTIFAEATFKATRLVNGQTVETVGKNDLNVVISHRFGNLNSGIDYFYGLDQSFIRLGLDYGISKRIDIGIGRSNEQRLVDSHIKLKLIRQASGAYTMPISVSFFSSVAIRTDQGIVPGRSYTLLNRLNFINELLIARKINNKVSIQIVPGILHRNLTDLDNNPNIVPYSGLGTRVKISSRIALCAEYYYVFAKNVANRFDNSLSFGFDIETGGHIFQLHFSNTRAMNEKIMIAENTNSWLKGDIGFGFNIIRNFNLSRR
jgi:hypothetical protein